MTIKDDEVTAPSEVSEENGEGVSMADMKKMMSVEVTDKGKKKSMWKMTMETMGMAGGKDGHGDLWVETVEDAIPMLKKYLKEKDLKLAEEQAVAKEKRPFDSWMDLVPLEAFHVTRTQFLTAFLKWAIKDREDIVEGSEDAKLVVNASKAQRRMDSYFEWMSENMAADLAKTPLTMDSIMEAHKIWELAATTTEDGKFVWWFDIAKMDQKAMKSLPVNDHLRYMVFFSHLIMFNPAAQDNGVLLLEELDKIGFWNCMTLIPMELSAKMDRLTIGVLPVKMKGIYMFGSPRWMNLMMGLMKPFLSKKMKERIISVPTDVEGSRQKFCDDLLGGQKYIPDNGFVGLKGDIPQDDAFIKLKKRIRKKQEKAAKKEEEKMMAGM
jgi:hypothetical protein